MWGRRRACPLCCPSHRHSSPLARKGQPGLDLFRPGESPRVAPPTWPSARQAHAPTAVRSRTRATKAQDTPHLLTPACVDDTTRHDTLNYNRHGPRVRDRLTRRAVPIVCCCRVAWSERETHAHTDREIWGGDTRRCGRPRRCSGMATGAGLTPPGQPGHDPPRCQPARGGRGLAGGACLHRQHRF